MKKGVRNSTLFSLVMQLSGSFLEALDRPFYPEYGNWYDRTKAILEGGPDFVAKILEIRPDLSEEQLSSCLTFSKKCLDCLVSDAEISRNPPHASRREEYLEELALLLSRILAHRDHFQMRNAFTTPMAHSKHLDFLREREYAGYERYLYDKFASNFVIAPLTNLVVESDIELGEKLKIRKIATEEFHSLSQAEESHGSQPLFYPETVVYLPTAGLDWDKKLARVVTALRLVKKELFGATAVYLGHANPSRSWEVVQPPPGTGIAKGSLQEVVTITEPEAAELRDLSTRIGNVVHLKYLELSMRRFNMAQERVVTEDSWIDYFVSLESLFSKGDEVTEVGHRLATRVARALRTVLLDSRRDLRTKVKNWYKKRSQIVHGLEVRLTPEDTDGLHDLVRESLKWFLCNSEHADHDKVIDALDLN